MAAKAAAPGARKPPPSARPVRPALPAAPADDEIICLEAGAPEGEPEPARVPLFSIGGTLYTMLAEAPPTIGLDTLQVSEEKGSLGYGEIHLLREMMGPDALNALLEAGRKGWVKRPQFNAIMARVREAALGAMEEDPNL
jgi:hypothetical protein